MIKEYVYARLAGRRNIVNNNRKPQQASQKYNGTEVSTHCYCSGQKYLIQNILRYFQICAAGVGGGGGGPQGWPPSLLRIGTASQHCSWPGCTLEREKSKTSKEAWGTSNVSYPIEPHLMNFKVKQVTSDYSQCSASRRLLTFANIKGHVGYMTWWWGGGWGRKLV